MTSQERAEKVFVACMPWDNPNQVRLIAAEIRAAVEEAKGQSNQMLSLLSYDLGMKDGEALAYADAAKIAENCHMAHGGAGKIHLDVAEAIRARAAEAGK